MADNTAGSVKIDIAGNLAPFEAALAKARQMADLFDAQVSKKLGNTGGSEAGLAKITGLIEQTNALLAKMTGVVTTSDAAMNKFAADATKASAAVESVKASSTDAAASVGKLASEYDSAAVAIQRAVSANQSFAASNRSLNAASNLRLADGSAASAEEMQAYAAALDDIRAKYNPLFKVTRDYLVLKEELRMANKLGAISETEAGAALSRGRQETLATIAVLKGHTSALGAHGSALGLGTTQTMALMHATRSFTEQLLLGVSPLQAATGQINHLTYALSGEGGPKAAFAAIGSSAANAASKIASFVADSPLIRAVGVAVGSVALGFGAIRDAASEAENRTVGWGETFTAAFQVIKDGLTNQFGPAIEAATSPIQYAFQKLGSAAVDIAELVINSFHAAFNDILIDWKTLPDQFGAFFVGAANAGIAALNTLVKGASDAIDKISAVMNNIPGVNIPLLNAKDQTIAPLDNKYLDNLKKAVADRNAAVEDIMKQTPLRDFASNVVDQIATNHALEGLEALSKISFDKATGSANGLSSAIGGIGKAASGVTVEYGGMSQQVINVSRAFEDAKRNNLINLEQSSQQLQGLKNQAEDIQKTLNAAGSASVDAVFGDHFTGSAREAKDAIDSAVSSVDKLFKAMDTGNISTRDFQSSLDMVRATLKALGGDPRAIDAFINSIINGQLKVRQLNSDVLTLGDSIKNLPNKTITITVRTQQVGSGTQSLYDVPSETTGGSTTVGVTRYGGVAGQQSGPSITANQVPNTSGYGSQGGTGDLGSSTVNVYRFATGGIIHPGDTQQVSFFKSPDETVAVLTPGQRGALANAQSGFTGRDATAENTRYWTVLMNIEANTRKTAQLLDDIHTSSVSSGLGSSGSSSSSSTGTMTRIGSGLYDSNGLNAYGHTAAQVAAFNSILASYKSNYSAIGGMGLVGYNSNGLAATPEQIATSIAYKGMSPVGYPTGGSSIGPSAPTALHGGDPYNSMLNGLSPSDPRYAQVYAQALAASNKAKGFATGGIDSSDTQKVEFFKNPNEKVIIATPQQFADVRPGASSTGSVGGNDNRPIVINQTHNWNGNTPPSKESMAETRRQTSLGIRDALKALNGR